MYLKSIKTPKSLFLSAIFSILWGGVKYLPAPWFNFLRYLILKMFCKEIHSTYIGENVTIWFPWNISIGRNVSINNGCCLDGTGGITIKDNTRIAGNVGMHTADHCFEQMEEPIRNQGYVVAPIIVEEDVWIGYGTNITKAVTIGKGAVIGCGSVITKNVSSYSVGAGNPYKYIKERGSTKQKCENV